MMEIQTIGIDKQSLKQFQAPVDLAARDSAQTPTTSLNFSSGLQNYLPLKQVPQPPEVSSFSSSKKPPKRRKVVSKQPKFRILRDRNKLRDKLVCSTAAPKSTKDMGFQSSTDPQRRSVHSLRQRQSSTKPKTSKDFFNRDIHELYLAQPRQDHLKILERVCRQSEELVSPVCLSSWNSTEIKAQAIQIEEVEEETLQPQLTVMFEKDSQHFLVNFCVRQQISKKPDSSEFTYQLPFQLQDNGRFQTGLSPISKLECLEIQSLTPNQANMYRSRTFYNWGLYRSLPQGEATFFEGLSPIDKELIFQSELLRATRRQLGTAMQNLLNTVNQEIARSSQSNSPDPVAAVDDYMQVLVWKNLRISLSPHPEDTQFDVLNYFKVLACREEAKPFFPNESAKDLMAFIRKKQVMKTKKSKFPLMTSCMGCLSSHSELANELKSCFECGARFHKVCRTLTQRSCTICESRRTKKVRVKECYLCPNRGLLYRSVRGEPNAHLFCLLANSPDIKIKSGKIVIPTTLMADQLNNNNTIQGSCLVCKGTKGALKACSDSDGQVIHASCAYLQGYGMQLDGHTQQTRIYKNLFDGDRRLATMFSRNYRSNYGRLAYQCFSFEEFKRKLEMDRVAIKVEDPGEAGVPSSITTNTHPNDPNEEEAQFEWRPDEEQDVIKYAYENSQEQDYAGFGMFSHHHHQTSEVRPIYHQDDQPMEWGPDLMYGDF